MLSWFGSAGISVRICCGGTHCQPVIDYTLLRRFGSICELAATPQFHLNVPTYFHIHLHTLRYANGNYKNVSGSTKPNPTFLFIPIAFHAPYHTLTHTHPVCIRSCMSELPARFVTQLFAFLWSISYSVYLWLCWAVLGVVW